MNLERMCCLASFPQMEHFTAGEHPLRSPVSRAVCVVNCVCAFIDKNGPAQRGSQDKASPGSERSPSRPAPRGA